MNILSNLSSLQSNLLQHNQTIDFFMSSFWPKSSYIHFPSIPNRLPLPRLFTVPPPLHAESHDEPANQSYSRSLWAREWLPIDILRLVLFVTIHLLCLCAPFHFTWPAFGVCVTLYTITGMFGITLSYHRHLTHRSFTIPKWLEYIFAYCGILAGQGNPIDWVSTHRYHHKFTDSEKDPHSPIEGFWFSHMYWVLDRYYLTSKCGDSNNVGDLKKQLFYRFVEKTYYLHALAPLAVLYVYGGVPFLVWGGGVRTVAVLHATFLVNSACHLWGERVWNTSDLSRNNWWVAILTFGEGWHNNHHAFESSARQGLEWWQFDMTWFVIRTLEAVGLATDVKVPTQGQKKRIARVCSINK